ncbi:MAG TPA: S1 RNA-binding domain-containing protein, partial [Blastocatellia bacterium]
VSDLQPGMTCPGIVTNVTNFGAFVDIGVHQDGLVHISQLSNKFVKDPREIVNPGDRVTVRVLEVNLEKQQIALTMKSDAETSRQMPRDRRAENQGGNQERRQDRGKDRDNRGRGQDKRQDNRPPRPEKSAFNNPFAEQLAKMKK